MNFQIYIKLKFIHLIVVIEVDDGLPVQHVYRILLLVVGYGESHRHPREHVEGVRKILTKDTDAFEHVDENRVAPDHLLVEPV